VELMSIYKRLKAFESVINDDSATGIADFSGT